MKKSEIDAGWTELNNIFFLASLIADIRWCDALRPKLLFLSSSLLWIYLSRCGGSRACLSSRLHHHVHVHVHVQVIYLRQLSLSTLAPGLPLSCNRLAYTYVPKHSTTGATEQEIPSSFFSPVSLSDSSRTDHPLFPCSSPPALTNLYPKCHMHSLSLSLSCFSLCTSSKDSRPHGNFIGRTKSHKRVISVPPRIQ